MAHTTTKINLSKGPHQLTRYDSSGYWYIVCGDVMALGSNRYQNRAAAMLDIRAAGYDVDACGDIFGPVS